MLLEVSLMSGPTTDRHGVYQHASGTRTCPHCGREISAYPTSAFPVHKVYRCPDRPVASQQTLEDYTNE